MKKKWTRRLAALLTACMLVSLFPVSAFAETAPETPQEIVEEMTEGNAGELDEEPGEDPAEQLDDQEIPATENDEETTIDSPAQGEAVEDEPEDDPPAEEEFGEAEDVAPTANDVEPRVTNSGWYQDPVTVKSTDAVCEDTDDGVHLKAGSGNGKDGGSDSNKWPAVFLNDDINAALEPDADGNYTVSFKLRFETVAAMGVFINYKDPSQGFFLGYNNNQWYTQRYGVSGTNWSDKNQSTPEANTTYQVELSWNPDEAVASFSVKTEDGNTVLTDIVDDSYADLMALDDVEEINNFALVLGKWNNSAEAEIWDFRHSDQGGSEEPEPPVDVGPALPTPEEIAELLKVQIYDYYNGSHRPIYTLTAADYALGNMRTFNSVYPYVCDLTLTDTVQEWVDKFNESQEFDHVLLTAKDGFLGTTTGVATLYYSAKEEKWCFPPSGSGISTPGVSVQTNGNFMQIYVRYGYSYRYLQHDGTPFVTDRFVSACSGSHSAPTYRPTGVPGYVENGKYYAFTGWQVPAEQDPDNKMVMIFRANYDEVEGLVINEDGSVTIPGGTKLGSSTIPLAVTSVTVQSVDDLAGLTVVRETMTLPDGASVLLHDGSTVTDESTLYCFTSNKTYEVLVPSTGLFLVSGSGATRDYKTHSASAPWVYKGESREGIKEVRVMEGVTGLGNRTFSGCENLKTVTLADSVTDLGISVFANCESLTQVTAMGLTEIGDMVFSECTSLKNVVFGSSLVNVNETAFTRQYASYTITDLIVYVNGEPSEQLTTALNHYPEKCTYNIANLNGGEIAELNNGGFATLKDREGQIFSGWFSDESKVENPAYDGTVYTARWEEANTSIQVSETVNGDRVNAAIENGMVTIPGGYTLWVDSEKIATVPKGITSVKVPEADVRGLNVFVNSGSAAANYTILTLPEGSMTVLPDGTTVNDTKLYCCDYNGAYPVIAPSAGLFVMSGSGAMDDFGQSGYATAPWVMNTWGNGITTVKIMEGVTYIGENAFYNCKKLTDVSIPESVQTIGKSAFENCVALKRITVHEGVREIKDRAFSGCEALTGIVLPDSVTTLGGWTFQNCSALETVELPAGISTSSAQTFVGCTGLKNLVLRGAPGTIDSPELLFGYSRPTDLTVYVNSETYVTNDLTTALNKLSFYRVANLNGYTVNEYMDGALAVPVKDGVAGVWYDVDGKALVKGEGDSYSLPEDEDFGAVYTAKWAEAGLPDGATNDNWYQVEDTKVSGSVAPSKANGKLTLTAVGANGNNCDGAPPPAFFMNEQLNEAIAAVGAGERTLSFDMTPKSSSDNICLGFGLNYSGVAQNVYIGYDNSSKWFVQYYGGTGAYPKFAGPELVKDHTYHITIKWTDTKITLFQVDDTVCTLPNDGGFGGVAVADAVGFKCGKDPQSSGITSMELSNLHYTGQSSEINTGVRKPTLSQVSSILKVEMRDYYGEHDTQYTLTADDYELGPVVESGRDDYPYTCELTLTAGVQGWISRFNQGKIYAHELLWDDVGFAITDGVATLYYSEASGWVIPSISSGIETPGISRQSNGNFMYLELWYGYEYRWLTHSGEKVYNTHVGACKDGSHTPSPVTYCKTVPAGYVDGDSFYAFTGWKTPAAKDENLGERVMVYLAQYEEVTGLCVNDDGSVTIPGGTVLGATTIPNAVKSVTVPSMNALKDLTVDTKWNKLVLPEGSTVILPDDSEVENETHLYCFTSNKTYEVLVPSTGRFLVSGTGAIADYSSSRNVPWSGNEYSSKIKTVEVMDGVTGVGSYAFSAITNMTSVTLSDSVTTIGANAFKDSKALSAVTAPGVTKINANAFSACIGLNTLVFGDAPETVAESAFATKWSAKIEEFVVYVDGEPSDQLTAALNYNNKCTYNIANLNGGRVSEVVSGTLATPERTGYIFQGWFDENDSVADIPDFNKTVYTAKWEKIKNTCVVTIDGEAYEVKEGDTLAGILPENPTKEGYTFIGWFDGEDKVTADTLADDGMTITSKWEINKYTVAFDAAGGRVNGEATVTVEHGETLGTLPTASRSGYRFRGWYLDGAPFDANTAITGDITLTAQWRRNSSSRPTPPVVEIEDPDTPLVELPFEDVEPDAWYKEAIDYVYSKNLMQGSSEDGFAPDVKTDRGTMAKVLYNLAGGTGAGSVELSFPDVVEGVQDVEAIYWAASHGLVVGYDNGNFGPRDNVTREQMAVMLYRYAQFQNMDVTVEGDVLKDFTDSESIGDWSREALAWAVSRRLFSGRDDGRMAPGDNATRAEVAAVVMRFHQMLEKDSAAD